jgi:hypothetical protein
MKKLIVLLITVIILTGWSLSFAKDVWVNGYYKSNGTYVEGHYRTAPDNNTYNNYSTYPNINPYTGKRGTVKPNSNSYGNSYGNSYSNPYNNQYNLYGD